MPIKKRNNNERVMAMKRPLEPCEMCNNYPRKYDAKTIHGFWALVCESCFHMYCFPTVKQLYKELCKANGKAKL